MELGDLDPGASFIVTTDIKKAAVIGFVPLYRKTGNMLMRDGSTVTAIKEHDGKMSWLPFTTKVMVIL